MIRSGMSRRLGTLAHAVRPNLSRTAPSPLKEHLPDHLSRSWSSPIHISNHASNR